MLQLIKFLMLLHRLDAANEFFKDYGDVKPNLFFGVVDAGKFSLMIFSYSIEFGPGGPKYHI